MKKYRTNQNPETNESENEKLIVLSRNQLNPGNAKSEDFEVQLEVIGTGQRGDSKAELARIFRDRDLKRRKPQTETPTRNDVNEAGKPGEGLD